MRRLTTEEFYKRHPDAMPGQEYLGTNEKHWFDCKEHGKYETTPALRDRGHLCKQCGQISQGNKRRISNKEFYKRHPDAVPGQEYLGSKEKHRFNCKEHGEYKMTPKHRALGQNCPFCSGQVLFIPQIVAPEIRALLLFHGVLPVPSFLKLT